MNYSKLYKVKQSYSHVYALLTDLKSYGKIHPLITKVERIETVERGSKYKIKEKPFPSLPFRFGYEVLVTNDRDGINYDIEGIPLTSVNITYSLECSKPTLTLINFSLIIESVAPGKKLLLIKMVRAQDRLMSAMQVRQ